MNMFSSFSRFAAAAMLGLCAMGANAQAPGHLNVPGLQMVNNYFAITPGLAGNQHHWLGMIWPDGRSEQMQIDTLRKQTLVLMDVSLLVFRPHGPTGVDESGEIYLGDVDAMQKGRPLQDQTPIVRYTMPANESRLVLRVTLAAGRGFSGYRQPVLVHNAPSGIHLNVRALGYVVAN